MRSLPDKESFQKLKLEVMRKSVVEEAVHQEMLYYPKLFCKIARYNRPV